MKKVWQNLLPVFSLIFTPLAAIYMFYALARGFYFGEWLQFLLSFVLFFVLLGLSFALGILSEG